VVPYVSLVAADHELPLTEPAFTVAVLLLSAIPSSYFTLYASLQQRLNIPRSLILPFGHESPDVRALVVSLPARYGLAGMPSYISNIRRDLCDFFNLHPRILRYDVTLTKQRAGEMHPVFIEFLHGAIRVSTKIACLCKSYYFSLGSEFLAYFAGEHLGSLL
jgi:hypothetical protein